MSISSANIDLQINTKWLFYVYGVYMYKVFMHTHVHTADKNLTVQYYTPISIERVYLYGRYTL